MRNWSLGALFLALIFSPHLLEARHQTCKPSGKVKGKKPPPDYCNEEDDICCIKGKYYTTYKCSPPVSAATKAYLYVTGFEKGGDGYKPSKCEHKYYSDDTPVVSLPTGWYSGGRRCLHNITISGRWLTSVIPPRDVMQTTTISLRAPTTLLARLLLSGER